MNRFLCLCLLGLCCSLMVNGQQKDVSGFVSDAQTGERLIGASVFVPETARGVVTDNNGFFTLKLNEGEVIKVSFVGFKDVEMACRYTDGKPLEIRMEALAEELQAVTVTASRMERPQFNVMQLTAKSLENLPTLGSRPDVIKAAQQLPGIEPINEGSSVMLVRGGSAGENLYMLDNVALIYVNHLGGFMSVFNPMMINDLKIYKGGFPARYGGKLSSIVDLTQKKGDTSRLKGEVSVGVTDLTFAVEGPGGLKSSSFILTGRKTLFDILMYAASEISKMSESQEYDVVYGFHDVNGKYSWSPDSRNAFSFNIYEGDDYMNLWKDDTDNVNHLEKNRLSDVWGNLLVSGNWDHVFRGGLFASTTMSFTRYHLKNTMSYHFEDTSDSTDFKSRGTSSVDDFSLRSHWKYVLRDNWTLEYGLLASCKAFCPNHYFSSLLAPSTPEVDWVSDNSVYLDNFIRLGAVTEGSIGLRANAYFNGTYRHFSMEPRLNLNFKLKEKSYINLTAMRTTQNAHLLMIPSSILANEIWIPADAHITLSFSDQVSVGWHGNFWQGLLQIEADAYYKHLEHLATYRDGYNCLIGDVDWRSKVESNGKGESYGFELLARMPLGRLNGYLGYTYSHTTRRFDNINGGKVYVYEYDRPHSINFNLNYKVNEKWSVSTLWTYHTGLPYTPMVGVQYAPQVNPKTGETYFEEVYVYGERNSERMKNYHRLDLSAKYLTHTEKGRKAEWTFSIYNVYCRQNPYYYYYGDFKAQPLYWDDPETSDTRPYLCLRTFFPIIPSFSYKVWF